jgi:truncated hemoglobin YjbI
LNDKEVSKDYVKKYGEYVSKFTKEDLEKYQCSVWLRLLWDSMKDIDNKTIRREILAHVYGCDHPTCSKVAEIMRGIKRE